ncbi:PP2C family protein-serine/threonine phosphatase [Pedobacter metabolipauper]|uniref:Protein phosphatase n=1 Tax=Pedobacter metabolipauper TaxID=425513 RepID=A0A4R6SVQ4_9SPHI|nr:protein phosphatase 2C domain-containing protein [Pedobacter metabolipauper]TDQ09439.1 protein phosphatase [Pedobacter metabolipauper]
MPVPLKIYSLNELGNRKNNEDSIHPPAGEALLGNSLFLVCDGVGGNSKGEVASELACRHFNTYFNQNLSSEDLLNDDFINAGREWVIKHFDEYIAQHEGAEDMSTTLTLAYLKKKSIFVAWCGDSRIYLIRDGEIVFQSQDHSLVNELVKRGNITPEEALTHPHRNVITRSLQAKRPYSEIQTDEIFDIRDNDYLLLCSDGLLEKVTPTVLKVLLTQSDTGDLTEQFQEYCYQKTRDNYSMYLIKLINLNNEPIIIGETNKITISKSKLKLKSLWIGLIILSIVLIGVLAAYFLGFFNK